MKRTSPKIVLFSLFAATALVFAACDNGSGGGSASTPTNELDSETDEEGTVVAGSDGVVLSGGAITDSDSSNATGTISLTDAVPGFANGGSYTTTGTPTTVTTRAALLSALANGGIIIIDGMIDMTDVDGKGTMLPSIGGGTTAALDAFVKANSTYDTYLAYQVAYAKDCTTSTNDKSSSSLSSTVGQTTWNLNGLYGNNIKLTITKDGTTLIGKTAGSGIKGGTIQISGKKNIQIRNIIIQDAYDPFPHHEADDGYNAEWDGINIQGESQYIWIDHVTFQDTLSLAHVMTAGTTDEKWQCYDGLCDIKNSSTNITISNCKFKNHDKTMLIGSSDTDGDASTRKISLYSNYFYNCGQRLPMVRNTQMHVVNNYYTVSNPTYSQQYAIGVRAGALISAEKNYFDTGIKYAFNGAKATTEVGSNKTNKVSDTKLFNSGNTIRGTEYNSSNKQYFTVVSEMPFTKPTIGIPSAAATSLPTQIPSSAGAGLVLSSN